jgi:Domain of Unknown Function (DUF1259)
VTGGDKFMKMNEELICEEFARIIGGQAGLAGGKCVATITRDEIKATIMGKRFRVTTSFSYESKDSCGRALCLGRVALLQKEVSGFVGAILDQGIEVSSIHNEWLFDDPKLIYVNIQDIDDPLDFARKVRRALRCI